MKVIVFSSVDCSACKTMKQSILTIQERNGFDLEEYFVEENLETFRKYGVDMTPVCVVVDDNDKEVGRFIGHQTEISAENSLRKYGVIE